MSASFALRGCGLLERILCVKNRRLSAGDEKMMPLRVVHHLYEMLQKSVRSMRTMKSLGDLCLMLRAWCGSEK
jgi:hypothetical protein